MLLQYNYYNFCNTNSIREIVVFITTQFCQNEKTHFNTHTIMEKIQTYNLKLSHKYNQF